MWLLHKLTTFNNPQKCVTTVKSQCCRIYYAKIDDDIENFWLCSKSSLRFTPREIIDLSSLDTLPVNETIKHKINCIITNHASHAICKLNKL